MNWKFITAPKLTERTSHDKKGITNYFEPVRWEKKIRLSNELKIYCTSFWELFFLG